LQLRLQVQVQVQVLGFVPRARRQSGSPKPQPDLFRWAWPQGRDRVHKNLLQACCVITEAGWFCGLLPALGLLQRLLRAGPWLAIAG